jgi:hypothetical protein
VPMGSSKVGGSAESVWGAFDSLTGEVDGGAVWTPSTSPDPDADRISGGGGNGADNASASRSMVKAPAAGGDKSNGSSKSPWHSSSNLFSRSIGGASEWSLMTFSNMGQYLGIRLNEAQNRQHSILPLH